MYMLINFIHMFQVLYISFKYRLKFVQSAYIHKEFCMQKSKPPSSVVVFPSCPNRISVGLIESLAQLKLFAFKHISDLTQKDWVCSHWHVSVKLCLCLSNKNCIHCSRPLLYPSKLSLSREFYNKSV